MDFSREQQLVTLYQAAAGTGMASYSCGLRPEYQELYRVQKEIAATEAQLYALKQKELECDPDFSQHPHVVFGRAASAARGAPIDGEVIEQCILLMRGDRQNHELQNMRVPTFRNWPIAFAALAVREWPLVRALYELGGVDWRQVLTYEYNEIVCTSIVMQPLLDDEGAFLRPLFYHLGVYKRKHIVRYMVRAKVRAHVLRELHALGCVFWDGKDTDTPIRQVVKYSHMLEQLEFFISIGVNPVLKDNDGARPIDLLPPDTQFWTPDLQAIHHRLFEAESL